MSEEINFDDIEFGEPIEEREPTYRDGYIRGIYRARNIIDSKQKEIERLNNIIEEIREYTKHKIVECYDEGSTIGEFYKICDIDSKIEELLHKGEDKE